MNQKAKRVDNGQWIIGTVIICGISGKTFILPVGSDVYESDKVGEEGCLKLVTHEVNPDTVCLPYGEKDGHGNDIYENDIIELKREDGEMIEVVCRYGDVIRRMYDNIVEIKGFYFELEYGRKTFPVVKNYAGLHDLKIFKVIGNTKDLI